jgi:glycosyltransferase involved in cell wall biosynthesis
MADALRILWLKTGPLHPLDTGGKIRTYNMLRELKRNNHLTYLSLWPDGTPAEAREQAGEYSDQQIWIPWRETRKRSARFFWELATNFLMTRLPYAIRKYESRLWADAIRQADTSGNHDLIVCDFLTPAVNLYRPGHRPGLPVLLFQHNVESLIWQRTAENSAGVAKPYFKDQWQRMLRFETEACRSADQVCAVSEEDARLLRDELKLTNVCGAVPTGVDVDFFAESDAPRTPKSLVFLGSMDWMPNIDGITWFAEKIWPRVKEKHSDATLTIVGRRPVPKVTELAENDASITVTGTVPDVRPHLAKASLMIVPLRVGGGTRIKIFEGMATGIPCLSTRIGAEGLPVTDGRDHLLADEPEDFAAAIDRCFSDPGFAADLGRAGRELVAANHSWTRINEVFEGYCRATARKGED